MDSLNLCWRGMSGAGKRAGLRQRLAEVAAARGLPFNITMKSMEGNSGGGEGDEGGSDEGAAAPPENTMVMMETSLVHTGFDIARMSMQDKQILKPILTNLGRGSQVLAGQAGRGSRILVLYHAHLLSSESVLLLQACLELNEGDVSIWLTSELPVAQRIQDWFVEIPVAGPDAAFEKVERAAAGRLAGPLVNWPDIFHGLLKRWVAAPPPTIEDVKEVKAFVYELLMRNLRWVEATHFLLDVLITNTDITEEQRQGCIQALANCEATGGGYTIPSYRIPILWESLFLQVRNIVHKAPLKTGDDSARSGRAGRSVKKNTRVKAS